jgi:hypothetical protein
VHPTKRWLAWGVVNYASIYDEYNITPTPAFSGYPYFHANNLQTCTGGKANPAAPVNNSPLNTGVHELPPAMPGAINNLENVALTGPIYSFDPSLDSKTKFPPQMNNTWITLGFQANHMHIHNVDSVAVKVLKTTRADNGLLAAAVLRSPTEAKYGPDGALYILNYDGFYTTGNPGVLRVDYAGPCIVPLVTKLAEPRAARDLDVSLTAGAVVVGEAGRHEFRLLDPAGRSLFEASGERGARYAWAGLAARLGLEKGLYLAEVKTARGVWLRRLPWL